MQRVTIITTEIGVRRSLRHISTSQKSNWIPFQICICLPFIFQTEEKLFLPLEFLGSLLFPHICTKYILVGVKSIVQCTRQHQSFLRHHAVQWKWIANPVKIVDPSWLPCRVVEAFFYDYCPIVFCHCIGQLLSFVGSSFPLHSSILPLYLLF